MTVDNNAQGVNEGGVTPTPPPAPVDQSEANFMALMQDRLNDQGEGQQPTVNPQQSRPGNDQGAPAGADQEAAGTQEQTGQKQDEGTPQTQDQPGVSPGVQKRFNQLTYEKKEAERKFEDSQVELAQAQERIRMLETQEFPPIGEEPKPDGFESEQEYLIAKMSFENRKQNIEWAKSQNAKRAENERTEAVKAHEHRMMSLINEQISANVDLAEDFDAVVRATEVSHVMRDILASSEHFGPAAYYLAKNPQVTEEIRSLPAQAQAVRMANILVHAALQKERQTLGAPRGNNLPPPIEPVGTAQGGGGFDKSNPNLTYEEYKKAHGQRVWAER